MQHFGNRYDQLLDDVGVSLFINIVELFISGGHR
jgi:hypothetical protein